MCFMGDCGTGKTILSVILLMHTGLVQHKTKRNLTFTHNDFIMYPGVIAGAAKDIGTDQAMDPQLFLNFWHSMSPQPPFSWQTEVNSST